jgi:hypothetical protein
MVAKHQHPLSLMLSEVESFLKKYVVFSTPDYAFAAALWVVGTYLWPNFDVFPYLVITSDTKRSGKTRFAEVLSFVSRNPQWMAALTPATIYRSIEAAFPTMFADEAESLTGESAGVMRTVLNVGYRRGQTIPRMGLGGEVQNFPAYCPKVFILIGDVNDTLRDRSIVVRMRRANPLDNALPRFKYEEAKLEGQRIANELKATLTGLKVQLDPTKPAKELDAFTEAYSASEGLSYLTDRDEELWLPLVTVCKVLAPERVEELTRVSVDMATEKTAEARTYVNLLGAEDAARDDEYAVRLIRDLLTVCGDAKAVPTQEALPRLFALATAPWRKYRGTGLTAIDMGNLLDRFGVGPRNVRTAGGRKHSKVLKGYTREDLENALKRND